MKLASPVYSGLSWSWGGWRGWVMSGPLSFRTIPVSSELGEGGTFSFQALCNFMRKGTQGNQLPNYPVGTEVDVALSPPGLPSYPSPFFFFFLPFSYLQFAYKQNPEEILPHHLPPRHTPGHLPERTWGLALRIPGQQALQSLVTCCGRNSGPCAHSPMAKRLTSIENRVEDHVDK